MTNPMIRVGVDIGGTFTDVALAHPEGLSTCKVLTNYSQPEQAILDGISIAADKAGIALGRIGQGRPRRQRQRGNGQCKSFHLGLLPECALSLRPLRPPAQL